MFKKNQVTIIIFVLLLVIALIYYFSSSRGTLNVHETDFIIHDTSSVDKIKVTNPTSSFLLSKIGNDWYYNEKSLANPSLIGICFRIMMQIQIKSVVSKEKVSDLVANIQKNGSLVIISGNNRPIKQYWIYADSLNHQIYMMMTKLNRPYLVSLPSFQGNFAGIFKTHKRNWRDKSLLHFTPNEISNIEVEQSDSPAKSFELSISEPLKYSIKHLNSNTKISFHTEAVDAYLLCFKYLKVEGFEEKTDSIIQLLEKQKPLYRVKIINNKGVSVSFDSYQIEKSIGNIKNFDLNYCYLIINGSEVAIAKYVDIDPITRDIDFFSK